METIANIIGTISEGVFNTINLGQQRRILQEQSRTRINYFEDEPADYTGAVLIGGLLFVLVILVILIARK